MIESLDTRLYECYTVGVFKFVAHKKSRKPASYTIKRSGPILRTKVIKNDVHFGQFPKTFLQFFFSGIQGVDD